MPNFKFIWLEEKNYMIKGKRSKTETTSAVLIELGKNTTLNLQPFLFFQKKNPFFILVDELHFNL